MNSSEAKREKMLSLVAAWRGSGQTQKQFCADHTIKLGTFSYWVTQSQLQPIPGFVPILNPAIKDKEFSQVKESQIEVIYPNGIRVRIQPNIEPDLALLSHLIHLY